MAKGKDGKIRGITLVALVVTIVVLLILAGITIMYVMGDNSIFRKDEQNYFNDIDNTINQYIDGNSGGSNLNDKVDVSTITEKVDKNILAKDSLGNLITIPEGFKVVPDGQGGVEYNYTGDKKPTVQDGIVIEDEEENQFVWIPVGNIKNKDGSFSTIELARYTFDTTTGAIKGERTDGLSLEDFFVEEVSTSTTYANTKAKDIENFKSKVKLNGGYYLARYEASKGIDNKVKSKVGVVWTNITQPDAAVKSREMYTSMTFESDLVNSYAWDTAIVFIQVYSGDSDYSIEIGPTFDSNLNSTGTTADKRCNIYDMASNTAEWTTETNTRPDSERTCTPRGGSCNYSNTYTALRHQRW